MKEKYEISEVVSSLMEGMGAVLDSRSVIGDPIQVGDTTLIPLVELSFAVGAGTGAKETKSNAAGGMGGKALPNAVLIIRDGYTKVVNIKNQDSLTKLIDLIPDIADHVKSSKKKPAMTNAEAVETVFPEEK